jgi:hypothetical protein
MTADKFHKQGQCPPWVKSGPRAASRLCPFIPQQRTCSDFLSTSALCQQASRRRHLLETSTAHRRVALAARGQVESELANCMRWELPQKGQFRQARALSPGRRRGSPGLRRSAKRRYRLVDVRFGGRFVAITPFLAHCRKLSVRFQ